MGLVDKIWFQCLVLRWADGRIVLVWCFPIASGDAVARINGCCGTEHGESRRRGPEFSLARSSRQYDEPVPISRESGLAEFLGDLVRTLPDRNAGDGTTVPDSSPRRLRDPRDFYGPSRHRGDPFVSEGNGVYVPHLARPRHADRADLWRENTPSHLHGRSPGRDSQEDFRRP